MKIQIILNFTSLTVKIVSNVPEIFLKNLKILKID